MNHKYIPVALGLVLTLLPLQSQAEAQSRSEVRRHAVELYSKSLWDPARTLFEQACEGRGDALCEGYVVLCAMKASSPDAEKLYSDYTTRYKRSTLLSTVLFEHGRRLFDEGRYREAEADFSEVRSKSLDRRSRSELAFKLGFCRYTDGDYASARNFFLDVDKMPSGDYSAPARYLLGFMNYISRDFNEALRWFSLSVKDSRFEALSRFYLVECQFMRKNYDYVLTEGVRFFDSVPSARQSHLARMISEAYLVRGDAARAREFYSKVTLQGKNRSDHFFSGSVLFAVKDYEGAISEYLQMPDRTDSLGQVANYQLGYSYIQTRNKIAALDAFKAASELDFNYRIKEDAAFNHAKLSFDLNHDGEPFKRYLQDFPTFGKKDKIYGYIAISALYERDYAAAVEAYDMVETLDEDQKLNYAKANYLRATQLISGGAWRDAVPYLKAAAFYIPRNDPFNQLARYWLAEAYYHSDSYTEALSVYKDLYNISALDGRSEGLAILYNVAYCHYRLKSYSTAAKWFDQYILSKDPVFREDAMTRRADCDFARRSYKSAAAAYGRVISEYPASGSLYAVYQQGLSFGLAGDVKSKVKALSPVRKASPSKPMYCESMYELGRAYLDLEDYGNAISAFSTLRKNASDSSFAAKALIGLGMTNRNRSAYDKALANYKAVVALMPGSEYAEDALLAIESIYQTIKEPEKFVEYVESNSLAAGKSDAERELMYFNAAEQLFLAQKYPQAIASIQKYMENYPQGSQTLQAWFYLAESYRNTGDKERACDAYAKVLASSADGPFTDMARLGLASQSYELERYQAAYDAYEQLLESAVFESNRSAARLGMMRSAYRARNYTAAIEAAGLVAGDPASDDALKRESLYVEAKSLMSVSRRAEAFELLSRLASQASTPEGAEARFLMIQDSFDKGEFEQVESQVYDFASASGHPYWLAKAFIVLGDAFLEKGNLAQARATYLSVQEGYVPASADDDIPSIVKMKLDRLNNE